MKKLFFLIVTFPLVAFSQGIINNGAYIVITNTSNIYINGATGNYTSQSGGLISNASAGGTITLIGNWTNNAANVAFNNDGSTVNFSGANQTIGGSNSSTFFNVNLLGSGTKTLNINTTVGGISTLTGVLSVGARILDLNSRILTITNPAGGGITYGAGYILSETNVAVNPSIIQWNMSTNTGAHIYPFGVAGTQVPFTFNKTTAGASNISVSTRATATNTNTPWAGASNVAAVAGMMAMGPPVDPDASPESVIDRWWDITASAAVTANLIFSYRGSENTTTIAPTGLFGAQHWDGTTWEPPVGSGTGVTAGVGTVSVTGASTFSPWVLSSLSLPLPIELIEFTGKCENKNIVLKWSTATETNNNYFTIEKSVDGATFYEIATINGAAGGNSTQVINYSYTDNSQNTGIVYYRLKQTDYDGQSKTFKTISVSSCGNTGDVTINAYSNNNGGVVVLIDEKNINPYSIKLFDAVGKLLKSESIYAQKGMNNYLIDVTNLSVGIYFISIENIDNRYNQKLYIR